MLEDIVIPGYFPLQSENNFVLWHHHHHHWEVAGWDMIRRHAFIHHTYHHRSSSVYTSSTGDVFEGMMKGRAREEQAEHSSKYRDRVAPLIAVGDINVGHGKALGGSRDKDCAS